MPLHGPNGISQVCGTGQSNWVETNCGDTKLWDINPSRRQRGAQSLNQYLKDTARNSKTHLRYKAFWIVSKYLKRMA